MEPGLGARVHRYWSGMDKAQIQDQVGPNSSSNSSASKQPHPFDLSFLTCNAGAKATYVKELLGGIHWENGLVFGKWAHPRHTYPSLLASSEVLVSENLPCIFDDIRVSWGSTEALDPRSWASSLARPFKNSLPHGNSATLWS